MLIWGHLYPTGRWFFFPGTLAIKSTLVLLLLLLLLPFARLPWRSRAMLFLTLPPAIWLAFSIASRINMGSRHILPMYPFLIVLAAAAAVAIAQRVPWGGWALAALLAFSAWSSLRWFPNYLPYANEAFGGPRKAYRLVADSDGDWGQGLKQLRAYLSKNPPAGDCWVGTGNAGGRVGYYGIPCTSLLGPLSPSPNENFVPPSEIGRDRHCESVLRHSFGAAPVESLRGLSRKQAGRSGRGNHAGVPRHLRGAPARVSGRGGPGPEHHAQRQSAGCAEARPAGCRAGPQSADSHEVLGRCLLAAGRGDEARAAFADALQLAQTIEPEYQQRLIDRIQSELAPLK